MTKQQGVKEISLPITKEKVESFFKSENIKYFKKSEDVYISNSKGVELEFLNTCVIAESNGLFIVCDYERIVQFSFSRNKNELFIFGTGCIISFKL